MADNNTDLPEGTDKVVAGSSGSASPGSTTIGSGTVEGTTGAAAVERQDDAALMLDPAAGSRPARAAPSGNTEEGGSFRDRLRSGTDKITGQAGEKARGFVEQGLERSAEALGNVSRMIGDTATGLDERLGQEYGDYARRAATAMENTANSLASKNPDELIDDTREFVRKSPGVALAGAAVVGFMVARLIKSGLGGSDDDDGGTPRGRGSEA